MTTTSVRAADISEDVAAKIASVVESVKANGAGQTAGQKAASIVRGLMEAGVYSISTERRVRNPTKLVVSVVEEKFDNNVRREVEVHGMLLRRKPKSDLFIEKVLRGEKSNEAAYRDLVAMEKKVKSGDESVIDEWMEKSLTGSKSARRRLPRLRSVAKPQDGFERIARDAAQRVAANKGFVTVGQQSGALVKILVSEQVLDPRRVNGSRTDPTITRICKHVVKAGLSKRDFVACWRLYRGIKASVFPESAFDEVNEGIVQTADTVYQRECKLKRERAKKARRERDQRRKAGVEPSQITRDSTPVPEPPEEPQILGPPPLVESNAVTLGMILSAVNDVEIDPVSSLNSIVAAANNGFDLIAADAARRGDEELASLVRENLAAMRSLRTRVSHLLMARGELRAARTGRKRT
jgi:hypothetical protein